MYKKIHQIIIIILLGSALWSCRSRSSDLSNAKQTNSPASEKTESGVWLNNEQQSAIGIKLGQTEMRSIRTKIKVTGRLALPPQSKADASLFIGGNVLKIEVKDGDFVKKGQTLALFQHPDYIELQQDFQRTNASIQFLKEEFERKQELYDNGVSSGKDFQKAKSDYQTAKIDLQALGEKLKLLGINPEQTATGSIRSTIALAAPISGYINTIHITTGQYASPQQSLFDINNPTQIYAVFQVYEQDLSKVKPDQNITFITESEPGKTYHSTIYTVGKSVDEHTKSIPVYARVSSPGSNLLPDLFITGNLNLGENGAEAPSLPTKAIIEENGSKYIFVYNPDDKSNNDSSKYFQLIKVETGIANQDYTEIKSVPDLPSNSKIVVEGAYYLNSERTKSEYGQDD